MFYDPKDVKELNLTDNPVWKGDNANTKGDKFEDLHRAAFICPVVGLEMNGRQKWVVWVWFIFVKIDVKIVGSRLNCIWLTVSKLGEHLV